MTMDVFSIGTFAAIVRFDGAFGLRPAAGTVSGSPPPEASRLRARGRSPGLAGLVVAPGRFPDDGRTADAKRSAAGFDRVGVPRPTLGQCPIAIRSSHIVNYVMVGADRRRRGRGAALNADVIEPAASHRSHRGLG
jgi:hypothetical protein